MAMEKSFGRFKAVHTLFQDLCVRNENNEQYNEARKLSDEFAIIDGRRPSSDDSWLGQDGHDRGAKIIATSFMDLGFDVDIGPLFQTPQEAALQAAENDVHILGISSLAAGHNTLVPETIGALRSPR